MTPAPPTPTEPATTIEAMVCREAARTVRPPPVTVTLLSARYASTRTGSLVRTSRQSAVFVRSHGCVASLEWPGLFGSIEEHRIAVVPTYSNVRPVSGPESTSTRSPGVTREPRTVAAPGSCCGRTAL